MQEKWDQFWLDCRVGALVLFIVGGTAFLAAVVAVIAVGPVIFVVEMLQPKGDDPPWAIPLALVVFGIGWINALGRCDIGAASAALRRPDDFGGPSHPPA